MALESATYISDLVSTNPVNSTDLVGAGDDHIRLLKSTIKATFPYVNGALTATTEQFNYLAAASSDLQTQINAKASLLYAVDAIGSYIFAKATSAVASGASIAGNLMVAAGVTTGGAQVVTGVALSGTWRCMGNAPNGSDVSLFLRIA